MPPDQLAVKVSQIDQEGAKQVRERSSAPAQAKTQTVIWKLPCHSRGEWQRKCHPGDCSSQGTELRLPGEDHGKHWKGF